MRVPYELPVSVDEEDMLNKNVSDVLAIVTLVLLSGVSGCHGQRQQSSMDNIPTARVALAQVSQLSGTLHVAGEFLPYQEVEVHAKVAGFIRRIHVDIGDRVHSGQLLAELEIPELNAQVSGAQAGIARSSEEIKRTRSMVARAEADHHALHSAYLRLQQVSVENPGLIAQQELDDARARDSAAESQVEAAKSEMLAQQEGYLAARSEHLQYASMAEYARILAPFNGVITWRYADKGALIQAGTTNASSMPVVKIAEVDHLRLRLPVNESLAGEIHAGDRAEIHVEAIHKEMVGVVVRTTGELDPATRTLQVEIDVDNRSGQLTPGMYAEIDLHPGGPSNLTSIPVTALMKSGGVSTVLVVNSSGQVEERKVQTGIETSDQVAVVAGLRSGEHVIRANLSSYHPGERVRELLDKATGNGNGKGDR